MNNLLERLRGPLYGWNVSDLCAEAAGRIEQLETALAQCRDAMPQPAPGERPEQSWSEAIGDPMAVPAYVKETAARLERENAELRKDAERYRWLRDQNADLEAGFYVGDETGALPGSFDWVGSDLDVAIDRAMKELT